MGNSIAAPAPETEQPYRRTCEICLETLDLRTLRETFRTRKNTCIPLYQFCSDCIVKYIKTKLDEKALRIPCPALNCADFLDPHDYRALVGPELFVRWCDALCGLALAGTAWCYCPNPYCSALILNECGYWSVKRATCPNCKMVFCFRCKVPWHAGFTCEESGEYLDQNDRAFGFLAEKNRWTRCPHCHHFVELSRGCSKITCRCGSRFCYGCGRRWGDCWCNLAAPARTAAAQADDRCIGISLLIITVVFCVGFIFLLISSN